MGLILLILIILLILGSGPWNNWSQNWGSGPSGLLGLVLIILLILILLGHVPIGVGW